MKRAAVNQVRLSRNPEKPHDCLLVLTTPEVDWKQSKNITRHLVMAERRKTPVYFYRNGKVPRPR